jgi:hypothetical protein
MQMDELFKGVISLTARVRNTKERDDIQTMAEEAYQNENVKALTQLFGRLRSLPPAMTYIKSKPRPYRQVVLGPNTEASGLPNPKIYNYFTNYNSPLNTGPPQVSQPYPLYANFGAYDKKSLYS